MNRITKKEILFQVLLHLVAFLFYSFDKRDPAIHVYELVFFINYALAALVISYYAVPKYYKDNNIYWLFLIIILCIITAVFAEEFVLEHIFFPGERANNVQLFYASFKAIPIIIILTVFKFGWDALHIRQEVDRLKDVARQSELQFLKSQINPHFLFNNLNNLYAYALEGSEKTPEIILELSGLLRYMLYECQEEYVSVSKEVEQLENFINLNKLQIEDRGIVKFNQSNVNGQYRIAPLILIVFIENAFKHSLSSQSENIDIEIDLNLSDDGLLRFVCKNNYLETSNTDNLAHGIGLENVTKRLELIYADDFDLECVSRDGVYKVLLTIKLKKV